MEEKMNNVITEKIAGTPKEGQIAKGPNIEK